MKKIKEFIEVHIDIFYNDFMILDSNENIAYENFSDKKYIIEYEDNDSICLSKPSKDDLIEILIETLKEKYP